MSIKKLKEKIYSVFKPETKIFLELSKHVELTITAINNFMQIFDADKNKSIEIVGKIEDLEKMGDEISLNLTRNILKGAVSLTVQDNLLELVNLIDNLLDIIHFLSKDINRFKRYLTPINTSIDFFNDIKRNMKHSLRMVLLLKRLFIEASKNNINEIVKLRDDIEGLEEIGDEIKDKTMEKLYEKAKTLDPASFILIRSYIFDIDELEDSCEDAANLVATILISLAS